MASIPELRPSSPVAIAADSAVVRRALLLGLVPVLALAAALVFVAGSKLADSGTRESATPVPAFLTKALGRPQVDATLVRRPARDFEVDVSHGSLSVSHSGASISL